MDYLYGKLNKEVKLQEFTGINTATADTVIDNEHHTIAVNVKNIPTPPTPIQVDDKTFTYEQIFASTEWLINHPLNKYPSVTLVDSGRHLITGEVIYNSKSQITVKFKQLVSGYAFLN